MIKTNCYKTTDNKLYLEETDAIYHEQLLVNDRIHAEYLNYFETLIYDYFDKIENHPTTKIFRELIADAIYSNKNEVLEKLIELKNKEVTLLKNANILGEKDE